MAQLLFPGKKRRYIRGEQDVYIMRNSVNVFLCGTGFDSICISAHAVLVNGVNMQERR
jgi:hypothetical protein